MRGASFWPWIAIGVRVVFVLVVPAVWLLLHGHQREHAEQQPALHWKSCTIDGAQRCGNTDCAPNHTLPMEVGTAWLLRRLSEFLFVRDAE